MTLDELLLEWSYRSEKGYPSLDNPSDVLLLEKILKELDLPTDEILSKLEADEPGGDDIETPGTDGMEDSDVESGNEKDAAISSGQTTEYDELIKDTFGGEIPKSKNTYKFTKSTFDEQVKPDDLEVWKKLWTVKPKKKTGDKTETLGVGKGELSLYWLYNHSNSPTAGKLAEGRGDDEADEDMMEGKDEADEDMKEVKDDDKMKEDADLDESDGYTGKASKGGTGYDEKMGGKGRTGYDAGSKALQERFQKLANIVKG